MNAMNAKSYQIKKVVQKCTKSYIIFLTCSHLICLKVEKPSHILLVLVSVGTDDTKI